MAEGTAVALLSDDAHLGAPLREALHTALHERGARIVHEGGLADLSGELIQRVGADVVVINLYDDDIDEIVDRLDEALMGEHPRVVFNEAEATQALEGWALARWARHLAAKVLAQTDVDPPRPPAPAIEPDQPAVAPSAALMVDAPVVDDDPVVASHDAEVAAESESLEAELQALLSSEPAEEGPDGEFSTEPAAESVRELDDFELDELALGELDHPPLYDGNFAEGDPSAAAASPVGPPPLPPAPKAPSGDAFALADPDDVIPAAVAAPATGKPEELFRRTDDWSLVDEDAEAPAPPPVAPRPSASEFGIEKVSALDFLAPESEQGAATIDIEPRMTLELVSMEEAVAPKAYDPAVSNEMMLEELSGGLSRVILLGATADSRDSVQEFLSSLPAGMRATIIHVQHQAGRPVESLVQVLSGACPLSVRVAAPGQPARAGELLVVPADHHLRMTRDGRMTLEAAQDLPAASPSIDATFSAVANVFGVDALAILFAGQANDAVAGCQAVHDRGGRIWVEDAPGEHFADMVSGVMAEHLADFSGTPAQLAARLIEEY